MAALAGNPAVVPLDRGHLLVAVGGTSGKRRLDSLVQVSSGVLAGVGMTVLASGNSCCGQLRTVRGAEVLEVGI